MKSTHARIADRLLRLDESVVVELSNGRLVTVATARPLPHREGEPGVCLVNDGAEGVPRDFFRLDEARRLLNAVYGYVEIGPDSAATVPPWTDAIGTSPAGDVTIGGVVLNRLIGGHRKPHFGPPELARAICDALLLRAPMEGEPRVPLLTCELCGDLGCGYTAVQVARDGDGYAWTWLGPSGAPLAAPSPWRRFRFERAEYEAFVNALRLVR